MPGLLVVWMSAVEMLLWPQCFTQFEKNILMNLIQRKHIHMYTLRCVEHTPVSEYMLAPLKHSQSCKTIESKSGSYSTEV